MSRVSIAYRTWAHVAAFNLLYMYLLAVPTLCSCRHEHTFNSPNLLPMTRTDFPTVFVAILVRNKEHTLPWFFGHLEMLHYPKDRMSLWIRSDHNTDQSTVIIKRWTDVHRELYHDVDFHGDDDRQGFSDERGPTDWSRERTGHVTRLRQQALDTARGMRIDYLLMLDADVILTNPRTLDLLIAENKTVIAPVMESALGDTYSNFWTRVPDYVPILGRRELGCFPVLGVHTVYLIDLREPAASGLYFLPPSGSTPVFNDTLSFAQSAVSAGVTMHVLNTQDFGQVLVPVLYPEPLEQEGQQFLHARIEALDRDNANLSTGVDFVEERGYRTSPHILVAHGPKDRLGLDKVYVINLKRRPERRHRVRHLWGMLGVDIDVIDAVDGRELTNEFLLDNNIKMAQGYASLVHKNPVRMGEIGCLMSHYKLWAEVVEKNYSAVMINEDDPHFKPYFRQKLAAAMEEANRLVPNWDFIYVARKPMLPQLDKFVPGSRFLMYPHDSYYTLSYILTNRGAQKLMKPRPLQKVVPVDKYISMVSNHYYDTNIMEKFYPRDLLALAINPPIIYPTHFASDANYVSDTNQSPFIHVDAEKEKGLEDTKDEL